jgi:hypothetical protein
LEGRNGGIPAIDFRLSSAINWIELSVAVIKPSELPESKNILPNPKKLSNPTIQNKRSFDLLIYTPNHQHG